MGIYINPGNQAFSQIADANYVDKTGLIALLNERIGGPNNLVCVSRPRRFGKSYAARMLSAYYDCSCDSHALFDHREIAQKSGYEDHLNHYHVISLDITGFLSFARRRSISLKEIPNLIADVLQEELLTLDPELSGNRSLTENLIRFVEKPDGKPFIFIIDEWDAVIREAKDDPEAQNRYLDLLREWFKNMNFTPRVVAAAYMTGILPIKKDGSQSAISDFREFTMLNPRKFGKYVGFTEEEVRCRCQSKKKDFSEMKRWYDGYSFQGVGSVYNPNSVIQAIENNDFGSYWSESSTSRDLMDYISRGYTGLTKTIAELIGGVEVKVNTVGFENDLVSFNGKDDILTLLIHLGYLAYDSKKETARIPNEEIRLEFRKTVRSVNHEATLQRLAESDQLFLETIRRNEEAVALQIEKVHREETSPLHYNQEQSLRSVIKLAYYTYRDHYIQLEELPGGEGVADLVYLPQRDSDWPVLVIELKWNQSAEGAIEQILNRQYPDSIKRFGGRILLVGISYNKNAPAGSKKHTCRIREYRVLTPTS